MRTLPQHQQPDVLSHGGHASDADVHLLTEYGSDDLELRREALERIGTYIHEYKHSFSHHV
jgi:hypothetical protein